MTITKFGRLQIVGPSDKRSPDGKRLVECLCDCGQTTYLTRTKLNSGHTKSCGCLRTTHGRSRIRDLTYSSWQAMKTRCLNANDSTHYSSYGGRGIGMCEEWNEFSAFLRDMGERKIGTTLGRKNNDRGYCPDNCRWETAREQQHNKRNTRFLECYGIRLPLIEWSEKTGIKLHVIKGRLKRGWPVNTVLTTPVRRYMSASP